MLSHEINIHREEMSKQALEFANHNKEKKAREALIRGAIIDDSVRKWLSFAEVAVRYAVEPQPLPSAKPQIMPSATNVTLSCHSCSTVGKKPVKDKKTTKQKKIASPSIGRTLKMNEMLRKKNAEIEAKKIAEEEEAAKDKEEEEETEDDVDNMENDVEDEEANLVEEQKSER
ncbi:hypothetical protein Tco_1342432 [Tanacetum coccineum]